MLLTRFWKIQKAKWQKPSFIFVELATINICNMNIMLKIREMSVAVILNIILAVITFWKIPLLFLEAYAVFLTTVSLFCGIEH